MTESDAQRLARLRAELAVVERLYAEAEATRPDRTAKSARRGPVSLIAVCLGVSLAVGVVAAIDLRRLETPTGAALAWAGAAVFGNCTAYRELSVSVPVDPRDADEQCRALRLATQQTRELAGQVALDVIAVEQGGDDAVATLRLERPERPTVEVAVPLRRSGDRWQVVLTAEVCTAVDCP